ncbi:MAG: marine proteobacterial sortase target protein [Proteobacteria bacterium]|nr:marine proteobacterial sortase target protein [Pseudomonadota bacterium]MCL2307834.1 marine proteobacterial sortase target protein [Pseudomonadota bacterium]
MSATVHDVAAPSSSSVRFPAMKRSRGRDLLRFVGAALMAGLIASLVLMAAILIFASHAYAQSEPPMRVGDDLQYGALLLSDGAGGREAAPLLDTVVEAELSGLIARVKVIQTFKNPSDTVREGVYAFPLPETAAVDRLEMKIGERRIQGQIKERQQARQIYEQAKQEGKKAALVEQWRPNLFTTRIAPIGPDDEIVVEIEYQQTLRYDQGVFSWRFPLAITPRYSPVQDQMAKKAAEPALREMPMQMDGGAHSLLANPVRFDITLAPGAPIREVHSRYHAVVMEDLGDGRYHVTLEEDSVPADRDFELTWTPHTGHAPQAVLFTERFADEDYWYLMLMPASEPAAQTVRLPREVTFIIDTSGSMEGAPIRQAKDALLMALERLRSGDFFNVIEFNHITKPLFATPVAVNAASLQKARAFVSKLRADGGTEMAPALKLALEAPPTPGMIGQVVFLTDGAVGNEEELFSLIQDRLNERRLFTVGIGSAPNAYFMTRSAEFGRGTFTFISDLHEVGEKMATLFQKLESPALTDVKAQWPMAVDMWPTVVGDLYQGEPVVIVGKTTMGAKQGALTLQGAVGGKGWNSALTLGEAVPASGVAALWARRKIDALLDEGRRQGNPDMARDEVVPLALKHHLVSRFTSLVAVDVTPSFPSNTPIEKTAMASTLPHGMDVSMAGLPAGSTSAAWNMLGGVLALLLAWALAWPMLNGRRPGH